MIKELFKELGLIQDDTKESINTQCPLHNERNGKSLYINFKKNFYRCFGKCHKGGNLQQLLKELGSDVILSQDYIIESLISKEIEKVQEKTIKPVDFATFLHYKSFGSNKVNYLKKRGISEEIYSKNHIYYSDYRKRIYIPVFFNNQYYGNITRSIYNENKLLEIISEEINVNLQDSKAKKDFYYNCIIEELPEYSKYRDSLIKYRWNERYLNDYSLPKDRILYEPLTNTGSQIVLLVEGSIDALMCNQYGYDAYASIGNGINQYHVDYLMQNLEGKILISAFDNDKAGRKYHDDLIKYSKQMILKLNWDLINRNVKDIPDLTQEELNYLIINATYL